MINDQFHKISKIRQNKSKKMVHKQSKIMYQKHVTIFNSESNELIKELFVVLMEQSTGVVL